VTTPLESILTHKSSVSVLEARDDILIAKQDAHCYNHKDVSNKFDDVYKQLSASLKKCVDIAHIKGTSSWLSALPIRKHGYAVHKQVFIDAVCFHYGWRPANLSTNCVCGKAFTIEHSLSRSYSGFQTIRTSWHYSWTTISSLFECTSWAKAPTTFWRNFAASYIQCRWSCQVRCICKRILEYTSRGWAFLNVRVFNPLVLVQLLS